MNYRAAFARYYEPLVRYAYTLIGDSDRAEDLAQEAFARLLEQDLPEASVQSWLFRVIRNLVRDGTRSRRRRQRLLAEARPYHRQIDPPDVVLERNETIERVSRALSKLPERDRTMLLLRHRGFSYAEIAQRTGVARSSVGTLLARALRRFERAYQKGNEDRPGDAASKAGGSVA